MSDINNALSALADAYLARGSAQARVRAKYAQFDRELAAAKEEDVDQVAQALIAAWDAGASVAATGRAMGATNIYNSRRVYYDRARYLQGELGVEDTDFLDSLYRKARGESEQPRDEYPGAVTEFEDEDDATKGDPREERYETDNDWVRAWEISGPDDNGVYTVNDPEGRVATITRGIILGIPGTNLAEFKDDAELHEIVSEIHGVPTKKFD